MNADEILRELGAPLSGHADPGEAAMAALLVSAALGRGYTMSVHDGEEWALRHSSDADEVLNALATTDADTLAFRLDGAHVGSVWIVWGNGCDLFSDWSDNEAINSLVEPIAFGELPRW